MKINITRRGKWNQYYPCHSCEKYVQTKMFVERLMQECKLSNSIYFKCLSESAQIEKNTVRPIFRSDYFQEVISYTTIKLQTWIWYNNQYHGYFFLKYLNKKYGEVHNQKSIPIQWWFLNRLEKHLNIL